MPNIYKTQLAKARANIDFSQLNFVNKIRNSKMDLNKDNSLISFIKSKSYHIAPLDSIIDESLTYLNNKHLVEPEFKEINFENESYRMPSQQSKEIYLSNENSMVSVNYNNTPEPGASKYITNKTSND